MFVLYFSPFTNVSLQIPLVPLIILFYLSIFFLHRLCSSPLVLSHFESSNTHLAFLCSVPVFSIYIPSFWLLFHLLLTSLSPPSPCFILCYFLLSFFNFRLLVQFSLCIFTFLSPPVDSFLLSMSSLLPFPLLPLPPSSSLPLEAI